MKEGGAESSAPPVVGCECPLCKVLRRILFQGHSPLLSAGARGQLVNNLRILDGELQDCLSTAQRAKEGNPVAAGEPSVPPEVEGEERKATEVKKEEPRDTFVSPRPKRKLPVPLSGNKTKEKAKSPSTEAAESGEEESEEESDECEATGTSWPARVHVKEERDEEEGPIRDVQEVSPSPEDSGRRDRRKAKKSSRKSRTPRRRRASRRGESRERSQEGLRLTPRSPTDPPPGYWDTSAPSTGPPPIGAFGGRGIIPAGKNNPALRPPSRKPWQSKGRKKAVRWRDIQQHGPDPNRKRQLEIEHERQKRRS